MDMNAQLREIDPFGYLPQYASAVKPLGGAERGPDPKYGFHTPYFEYRPGTIIFTICFDGLTASKGELHLHLNAYIPNSGKNAVTVRSIRTNMGELAAAESPIEVRVQAQPGVTYAVYGFFTEPTDASATKLSVHVAEWGDAANDIPVEASLPTTFGAAPLERPSALIGKVRPSFSYPVSQVITPGQLGEADFAAWLPSLASMAAHSAEAWKRAFVLQALARYGMLESGAMALALGDATLVESVRARDCPVLLGLLAHGAEVFAGDPDAGVTVRAIDLDNLPDDLYGFDFLWSIDTLARFATPAAAANFVGKAMRALRPGGFAVHTFDMLEASTRLPSDYARGGILNRQEIERLALTLVAKGDEIAQLNFDDRANVDDVLRRNAHFMEDGTPIAAGVVAFGLIVRRGSNA